ncbi:MAG: nucleoside-diphosphate kinase [Candidatus Aenigmarchaeota archaeon]|nr:nucleoside-diphosphate kinase [Candidatus Aenigmarchaeota archaeon]
MVDHQLGTTLPQELYADEITLGIVKPHAYSHRMAIENMITKSGLLIPVRKFPYTISPSLARLHYEEHHGKYFYEALVEMMTSGPSEIMIVEGENAIQRLADLSGETDPRSAATGTIRHRFGQKDGQIMYNAFHRSFDPDPSKARRAVKREITLYFDREELPPHIAELLDAL